MNDDNKVLVLAGLLTFLCVGSVLNYLAMSTIIHYLKQIVTIMGGTP